MASWFDQLETAVSTVRSVAREVPGVRWLESQAEAVERTLVRAARRHLAELEAGSGQEESTYPQTATHPIPEGSEQAESVAERMRALLQTSMYNTPDDSRRTFHEALVDQLVPDEARILSALSDGSTYPMVHIAEPGRSNPRRVLENISSVGRAAGVALPDRTHHYVTHLRRLGLVESGPEDTSINDEYEILQTDPLVRATVSAVTRGPRGARIQRRVVRISPLGSELWAATLDTGNGAAPPL